MAHATGDLSGRTALVTGGGRRIGRALVLGLARAGADVVVHYHRSRSEAQAAAAEARRLGVRAWALPCDLSQTGRLDGFMDRLLKHTGGRLDILVNNASAFPESRLVTFAPAELDASVRLHATSPLLLARRLAALNRPADIVNLLDARVTTCDPAHAAYHLGKSLFFSLTRLMAVELAPRVRVNAVAPGAVLPPAGHDAAYLRRVARGNPLGTWGSVGGLVDCVLFLLRSDFLTGQVIYYDGGHHLRGTPHA